MYLCTRKYLTAQHSIMAKEFKRTLVTSALPYANGPIHTVILPEYMFRRYLCAISSFEGRRSNFIGGSDEHGIPITVKARNEGVTPQDIVDKFHYLIKDSFEQFGISFDIYSRTTSEIHKQTASEFF